MDLATLDTTARAEQGAPMHLLHPVTGAPLLQDDKSPITITLAGADSERYRSLISARANKRLQETRRRVVTVEAMENEALDLIVGCTLGSSGTEVDGEAVTLGPDNARAFYQRFPWAREQADTFIASRAGFLPD